jgi:integrase
MKAEARRIANEAYEIMLKSSKSSTGSDKPLSDYIDFYIQSITESGKAKSTLSIYHRALKNFLEHVGNIPLKDITKADLETYKISRKNTLSKQGSKNISSSNTINIEIRSIKTAFNFAVRIDLLANNPLKEVKQFSVPKSQKRIHLNQNEITELLDYIDNEIPDKDIGKFVKLCLFTGCRSMSARSLKWNDIDFNENTIIFANKPGGTYKIPMNKDTKKLLRTIKKKHDYVLYNKSTKKPYERSWATHGTLHIFRQLEFPQNFSAHNLRHTFASHLVMKGVHLKIVADLLGQSYERTALIYSHLDSTSLEKATNLLQFSES